MNRPPAVDHRRYRTLAAVPSPPPPPAAPPVLSPDDEAKLAAIAAALGVEPTDIAGIKAALDTLLGPSVKADEAAAASLTAGELAHCRATGCAPATFLRLKRGAR